MSAAWAAAPAAAGYDCLGAGAGWRGVLAPLGPDPVEDDAVVDLRGGGTGGGPLERYAPSEALLSFIDDPALEERGFEGDVSKSMRESDLV